MDKIKVTMGIYYIQVPEEDLRILCGCPENSIKFIMQKGLTPPVVKNGFNLVSGPNTILLNDISILNSHFLNFAEFPVLHQQYFQGAAFNGTHEKFTLIGMKDRVDHQAKYIIRGDQGLQNFEEIKESGIDSDIAQKFLSLRKTYQDTKTEFNILNKVYINGKTRVKGDLFIERISLNKFKFTYKDEEEIIDLNFNPNAKGVGLPYNIKPTYIPLDDFVVTTVGDGNGWNPHVPCMGAVITVKGKRYLVDSGPGSLDLIKNLGISPSEIDGVFITHSHDDHFAGILSLLNGEYKMKFFATSIVRLSVQKKFESLLDVKKDVLKRYIDFIDLEEGKWTNFGDFEVKPNYSFHTVETNVFYFRVKNQQNEYKTYGHITDIISKKDLDKLIEKGESNGLSRSWAYPWFDKYLEKVDLKRVDAGGGVVHGDSHDFADDKSDKIILSHLDKDIDTSESPRFCKPTAFGHSEVLVNASGNYLYNQAEEILSSICGKFPRREIKEDNIQLYSPGEIIHNLGDRIEDIHLVLSGYVFGEDSKGDRNKYIKGDFLYTFNKEKKSKECYVCESYAYIIKLKPKNFFKFIKSKKLPKEFSLFRNSNRFSYGLSFNTQLALAKAMKKRKIKNGQTLNLDNNEFYIVTKGSIEVAYSDKIIDTLIPGNISVNSINIDICPRNPLIKETALCPSEILVFKRDDILGNISFMWNLIEEYMRISTIVEIGSI